jgi:hypothetical protein
VIKVELKAPKMKDLTLYKAGLVENQLNHMSMTLCDMRVTYSDSLTLVWYCL